jgi:peptidyl-prolyl cis-trans isomerase D
LLIAAEELKDLVFNASDLDGPAAAIEVSVKTSEPFTLEKGAGPFDEQRVRDLAFAPDVKDAGNNSDVIELSGQRFIVVRVNEVKPSQIAPFADVESQVRAEVAAAAEEEALAAIVGQAESMLMEGASVESVSKELSLEWRVELSATRLASQLPRPVRDAAFTMPAGDAAALRTVTLPGEGYAIVQLARVTPGEPSAITQTENQQLSNLRVNEQQQLSFDEFLVHQRDSADIVIR